MQRTRCVHMACALLCDMCGQKTVNMAEGLAAALGMQGNGQDRAATQHVSRLGNLTDVLPTGSRIASQSGELVSSTVVLHRINITTQCISRAHAEQLLQISLSGSGSGGKGDTLSAGAIAGLVIGAFICIMVWYIDSSSAGSKCELCHQRHVHVLSIATHQQRLLSSRRFASISSDDVLVH